MRNASPIAATDLSLSCFVLLDRPPDDCPHDANAMKATKNTERSQSFLNSAPPIESTQASTLTHLVLEQHNGLQYCAGADKKQEPRF